MKTYQTCLSGWGHFILRDILITYTSIRFATGLVKALCMFKDVGAWYIIEIYEIKSIEIENSMSDIWVNKHDISLKENILYSIYIHIYH